MNLLVSVGRGRHQLSTVPGIALQYSIALHTTFRAAQGLVRVCADDVVGISDRGSD